MAKLGEIIIQIRGVSYNPQDLYDTLNENSIPLLRANNIQNGNIVLADIVYVSKAKVSEKQYLKRGDILICTSSGSKELVGKAAFIEKDMPITFGAFCKVIRPIREYQKYIGYFFQSPYYRRRISELSAGANINNIRNEHIENLEICLPKIEEQQYIAAVLDKVTDLIAQRRAQLDKLDLMIKSRFVEMFGDCNYPHKPLIDLIVEGAGLSYGIVQPGNDGTGDMGVIRPVDLVDGKISMESIKHIDQSIGDAFKKTELTGDELLITVRGTTGITALSNRDCKGMNVTRGIAVIRYDRNKINPVYLNAYLNAGESQNYIQEHTRGATLQQINLSDLRILQILVPPMSQQKQLENFVNNMTKLKETIASSLNMLEVLKSSFMQKYFE